MINPRVLIPTLLLATAGVALHSPHAGAAARAAAALDARADETRRRDDDIAFFERRVAADPMGAADRSRLAALYLRRGRETADLQDYRRAEALARRSLALRVAHNSATYTVLASALLSQHRFTEALAVARTLDAHDPGVPTHRAVLAEIELELGRYDAARATFDSLWLARRDLAVAPRLARWVEINGDTARARQLLVDALAAARQRTDLPAEQVAWFYLRVGDLALRYGRLDEAEHMLRQGLEAYPADARLLAAMARLEAARRDWRQAVAFGDRAVAELPDPVTFGVISDAWQALGDTVRAAEYARAMEVAVLGQPGQWHRAWSLFLLDHHRRVPDVLAKVQEEIRTRRDVYGFDLLAWALHSAGRDAEARSAMARALALGTREPLLLGHARAIGMATP